MSASEVDQLVKLMSKIPGLGPRSARRAALHLIQNKEVLLQPLANAMSEAAENVRECSICGNLDTSDPCLICQSHSRDRSLLCVVENVSDLWALERAGAFNGYYHALGGTLSALDGVGPEDLRIEGLMQRAKEDNVKEVILALNATVDGQTTAHYLTDRLEECDVKVSHLAHGVPVGGELDYMDDGTLTTALKSRRTV